jgi:hypothetical protein
MTDQRKRFVIERHMVIGLVKKLFVRVKHEVSRLEKIWDFHSDVAVDSNQFIIEFCPVSVGKY